jgi:selenocysteine-specific elongation factor
MAPGSRAFVRLRLEAPMLLARGDRYIVRAYSPPITIAGGVILDPRPPRTAIRRQAALDRCVRLDFDPSAADREDAARRAAAVMIADTGANGFPIADLVSRAGASPAAVDATISALTAGRESVRAGDVLVLPSVASALKDAVVAALAEHHRAQPLSEGIPREELRDRLFGRGHPAIFDLALQELAAAGTVAVRDRVALSTHRLELSPEEEKARRAIELAFKQRGLSPPDVAAIATETGTPAPVADRVLKLLQRQKVLVRVDTLLFHDEALKQLKAEVAALKRGGGAARIDVATFKERFGVTRKFAIPLLEYLDRERVTRRMGDARVVL